MQSPSPLRTHSAESASIARIRAPSRRRGQSSDFRLISMGRLAQLPSDQGSSASYARRSRPRSNRENSGYTKCLCKFIETFVTTRDLPSAEACAPDNDRFGRERAFEASRPRRVVWNGTGPVVSIGAVPAFSRTDDRRPRGAPSDRKCPQVPVCSESLLSHRFRSSRPSSCCSSRSS